MSFKVSYHNIFHFASQGTTISNLESFVNTHIPMCVCCVALSIYLNNIINVMANIKFIKKDGNKFFSAEKTFIISIIMLYIGLKQRPIHFKAEFLLHFSLHSLLFSIRLSSPACLESRLINYILFKTNF